MRGVTAVGVYVPVIKGFQPALPMRGVTPHEVLQPVVVQISTRTPHAGSDLRVMDVLRFGEISTRTPHAGSDYSNPLVSRYHIIFQPALPMRGVTAILCAKFTASINI